MTKGQKFFQFCLSHGLFEPMALPRWNTLTEVFFTGLSPSTACARWGQDGLSRGSLASGGDARRTRLDAGPGQGRGKARRGKAAGRGWQEQPGRCAPGGGTAPPGGAAPPALGQVRGCAARSPPGTEGPSREEKVAKTPPGPAAPRSAAGRPPSQAQSCREEGFSAHQESSHYKQRYIYPSASPIRSKLVLRGGISILSFFFARF